MSVQSRRKPSKLFTAAVYGFIWAVLLTLMAGFVWGTRAEIRTQTVGERAARSYIVWYFLSAFSPAVIAFCWMGGVKAPKRLYLTVQLANFTVLLGVFWWVLSVADGNGLAFFLGNPEPGVLSTYEAFYIWLLCTFGLLLLTLSVMNDKDRNEIRIGVGGVLFIIGILLPKMLDSYELLRATCWGRPLEELHIQERCLAEAIETIPMFKMALAFSVALIVLFFFSMVSPTIERFISALTGDGADEKRSGALSDAQEGAEPEQNLSEREPETVVRPSDAESLPSARQGNSHFGSFTAAVLGGAVVWMIQAIGERMAKHR